LVELNGTLLFQIANFFILCAILGHFCYKPMLKVLDDRKQRIRNDLDSAAASAADAKKLKEDYEAQLRDAQAQAQEVISKAVKEAQVQAQAQIEAAREAIAKEKDAATRQIEKERIDALEDLKGQVAQISCEIASKIISKNMTPEANDALITESIAQLGRTGK
jgi:F-type H+-transporting ATPase subunit b